MSYTSVETNSGSGGPSFAVDSISSILYQRFKISWGTEGNAADVSASNPFPVTSYLSPTDNAVLDAIAASSLASEGYLATMDVDSGAIVTATQAIQAAVEGTLTVGSHAVTNAGTFAVQADSVIPGTGATNLGKAKGDAVGATDTGVAPLARLRYAAVHTTDSDGGYDTPDLTPFHQLRTQDQLSLSIQDCNDYTDFTVLGNDTTNLADSLNHVFGTGAITFNKANGAGNTVYAGVQDTITAVNIAEAFEDGAFVSLGVYLPSLTDVVNVFIRLGTDSSNYNEWKWEVADLTASRWLSLRTPTSQPDGYTGDGWDTSAITYVSFGVEFSDEADTLSGIIFDNVHLVSGRVTDSTTNATISSSVTTPNINVHRMGGNPTDTNTGNASAGTMRVVLATDQPSLANALLVDGSAVTQPVSGTVTANAGTNLNTSTLALEAGGNLAAAATSLAIIDDWDETNRAAVNIVSGQAGITAGAGAVAASTPRVTLASDDPAVALLTTMDADSGGMLTSLQIIDNTIIVDDAAFTPATTSVNMAGFFADEASTDSVGEGDAGAARMTLDRKQIATPYSHAAAGGTPSHYRNIDANAEAEIKGGAGRLAWVHVMNMTASVAYVHLYDALAASVTPGTTTPSFTFPIPTLGDTNGAGFALPLGAFGQQFATGITLVVTTTIDGSAGDPGTNGVFINAGYH